MYELTLTGVKKYMDATLVLKNITFSVYSGEKVGIVGANGSGKSTILKLIAGIEPMNYCIGYPGATSPGYDEGFISVSRDASVAYLEQIPDYPEDFKVIDVLKLAFEEVYRIEEKMRELESIMNTLEGAALDKTLKQYGNLVQQYEIKGGYNTEEKLNRICTGLKFSDSFLNKGFALLSGGEKTTVILGKLLMDNPDILLLDEPTNHLDVEAVEWLESYLKAYKGIIIIVSHDRYFLDHVVSKIVEIEDMEADTFKGNYSEYVQLKEEKIRIQFENFLEQQKKINAIEKSVKELRDWAMRADNNKFFRRAASMQIRLDKMERMDKPVLDRPNMRLNLKAAERSGKETMKAIGLTKRFEDKIIFDHADMMVTYGERTALIGPNGSGKTTFIKLLLGEELPESGIVELGANVQAAYLPQNITFPNMDLTVLECFREDIFIQEGKAREYLSKYMFYGNSVFKKVKHLSGGEKIRLKLSKLLYEDVNLLILDEPTNHLDIDSIETLEEALEEFGGTIFFISHDRYFINKISDRIIAIENHIFKSYPGNYDNYKNAKEELAMRLAVLKETTVKSDKITVVKPMEGYKNKENDKKREIDSAKTDSEKADSAKVDRAKADRIKANKSKADIINAETKIHLLEKEIAELELSMVELGSDYEALNKQFERKAALSKELEEVMEKWINFSC
ncbi:MAG: transporter ATP-binding protein [Herbinix sp.]|jgi:ATPase subunit of ABC transporter with duplicated ATPase domains|nr:transporter ATP-binding protein [Herbinix sp.]